MRRAPLWLYQLDESDIDVMFYGGAQWELFAIQIGVGGILPRQGRNGIDWVKIPQTTFCTCKRFLGTSPTHQTQ